MQANPSRYVHIWQVGMAGMSGMAGMAGMAGMSAMSGMVGSVRVLPARGVCGGPWGTQHASGRARARSS